MSQPGRADVDAILYDFGGVVIEINFDWIFERWAELAGVPMAQVKARFSHGEAYQRHERGEIGLAEYYQSLRRDLGIDLSDAQFTDGWQRVFGPEYPGTVAIIRALAGRVPQYLMSNTNQTHYDFFSKRYAAALAPLDGIFTSVGMQARKPEPESFRRVSTDTGVALDRMLFLDDTESNLEGARALGMHTVLVRSQDDVARALQPWLT